MIEREKTSKADGQTQRTKGRERFPNPLPACPYHKLERAGWHWVEEFYKKKGNTLWNTWGG